MTTHRNQVIFISVAISLLIRVSGALAGDYINYRLLPGSTFTQKYGYVIIGPPEALTGTFQGHYEDNFMTSNAFKITSLHFESFSHTLNLSANNNDTFSTRTDSDYSIFRAYPNNSELPIYSKAMVPLKGFRDKKTKSKEPIPNFRPVMGEN